MYWKQTTKQQRIILIVSTNLVAAITLWNTIRYSSLKNKQKYNGNMILEKLKTLEIESIGDTEDGIAAGIAEESLPFVFEFMSTQLYSNPIGSLIREITSNCFDSHVEAGVEDPVIISRT